MIIIEGHWMICSLFGYQSAICCHKMVKKRVFVVTGSQRGIGYGIVKTLAVTVPDAIIYMTDMHNCMLQDSMRKLDAEMGKSMKAENQMEETLNEARLTIATNYEGTKLVSQQLFPLMRDGGRVVNIASRSGSIQSYDPQIKAKLSDKAITIADVDAYVQDFLTAFEKKECASKGYPKSSYRVSKTTVILLARIWARELAQRRIVVNACCPGYVNTDMSRGMSSPLTIEQGATTPAYLATLQGDEPNGQFVYLKKVTPWY
uniref:Carbonyl reductase n=2 Tax=Parascaris univalens TaxID=6257 RepID=A0A915BLS5_PARUN